MPEITQEKYQALLEKGFTPQEVAAYAQSRGVSNAASGRGALGTLGDFAKEVGTDLTRLPARAALNVYAGGRSLVGDQETAQQVLEQGVDSPTYGPLRAIGATGGGFGRDLQDTAGAGTEAASFLPLPGARALTQPIRSAIRQGAFTGGAASAGRELQEDDPSAAPVAAGFGAGAAVGALTGPFGLLVKPIARRVSKAVDDRFVRSEAVQAVNQALGNVGRKSAEGLSRVDDQRIQGLQVINELAPYIAVTDRDGIQKTFNPAEATLSDSLQALVKAKNMTYEAFSRLAQDSEHSAVPLDDVTGRLAAVLQEPRSEAVKGRARQLLAEIASLPENVGAINTYLKDLNEEIAKSRNSIDMEIAVQLRKKLEDAIDEASDQGPQFTELRHNYAALKSIENDLVRRSQQQLRRVGGGLGDYADVFSSGELLYGMLSAQPVFIAKGLAQQALTQALRITRDPDRLMRNAFEAVQRLSPPQGSRALPLVQEVLGQ